MSDWNENLVALSFYLPKFYRTEDEIYRVGMTCGIDMGHVELRGSPIQMWHNTLYYVNNKGRIPELLTSILAQGEKASGDATIKTILENIETGLAPATPNNKRDDIKKTVLDRNSDLELIIEAKSTLLPISFLEKGLRSSKAVARIIVDNRVGTGFLVDGNVLVTNNHVIPDHEQLLRTKIQFNYQKTVEGADSKYDEYELASTSEHDFITDPNLDYTCIRLNSDLNSRYGNLDFSQVSASEGDFVNIIQHPGGGSKQIALYHNYVVSCSDESVDYLTDTEPGSSGSPVFNSDWQVVAIHRKGIKSYLSESQRYYRYNQGINIQAVVSQIRIFQNP